VRFLLAGRYQYDWYEKACASALEGLGHEVHRFGWLRFFRGPLGRMEDAWVLPGLATLRLNLSLRAATAAVRPDAVIVWRGTHVLPGTLRVLRGRACIVSYNNDDPFSPAYSHAPSLHLRRLWRVFRAGIPEYDMNFVYRPVNIADYRGAGARTVRLLMPYFIPGVHRPLSLDAADQERYAADAVFVGHWEPDGRLECLRALREGRLRVRIFGTGWPRDVVRMILDDRSHPQPVFGDAYAKALAGARVCLSFLSKINRDTYTRRSFEIPACGRPMVGERSQDLQRLFREDEEAVFFSSPSELVQKVSALVASPPYREALAQAGRRRCLTDGHDVVSRMRELVSVLEDVRRHGTQPLAPDAVAPPP
jgi:spore maturation protein CgeB